MSISSVSSASFSVGVAYTGTNSGDEITQLEKQKSSLEKELQKENQSKDDAKTKQEKISQIQQQIQLVEAQIEQLKSGKAEQNQQAATAGVSNSLQDSDKVNSVSSKINIQI